MKKSKKIVLIVISCIVVLATIAGVIFGIVMNQPASVVTKFEEKRAKEIASLKEKKPGYIISTNNRADYVKYCLMLYNTSDTAAENFVKKHGLKKKFPKAEIEAGYGLVTLKFKRDDYTKSVHNALTKFAKDSSSVQLGNATVYPDSRIWYKPDISLHAKNPTTLEFEFLKTYSLSSVDNEVVSVDRILATKADYDAYVELVAAADQIGVSLEAIQSEKDKYGEDFFESNALLVTRKITRGDGGYGLSIDNVYLSDNNIYVVIRTSNSEGNAPQMVQGKTFYIAVSKEAIKGATELITLD